MRIVYKWEVSKTGKCLEVAIVYISGKCISETGIWVGSVLQVESLDKWGVSVGGNYL